MDHLAKNLGVLAVFRYSGGLQGVDSGPKLQIPLREAIFHNLSNELSSLVQALLTGCFVAWE